MGKTKWANKEKAQFLDQLGQCLRQGYSLITAIELLSYHEKMKTRQLIKIMVDQLKQGEALHEVFLKAFFPKDICGFIYFSEQHGDLSLGLIEGGKMLKQREQAKLQLQHLMRYPLLLLWLSVILFYIMLKYLYPQFQVLYASMDIPLPLITRIFLSLNHLVFPYILPIIILLSLMISSVIYLLRHTSVIKLYHLLLRIPYFNTLLRVYLTYYLSLHLGSLLKVGMSISTAFNIMKNQSFMIFFKNEAERAVKSLLQGESLPQVFSENHFYTKDFPSILSHGQINGLLGKELFDFSQLLLKEMEDKLKNLLAFVQPLLLIFVGGFTLILFLSILLPVFQMINGF